MKLHEILKEQFLTNHVEIKAWLDEMKIENYVIKSDGIVDVYGYVDIVGGWLTSIPVQFGVTTGIFSCSYNHLTSLAGCPSSVGGNFRCSANNITSLEGIADQITSLKGKFVCDDNKIKSHVLGLMLIEGLQHIQCSDKWAKILNDCIVNGLGIYDAQTLLNDAELEAYAQL